MGRDIDRIRLPGMVERRYYGVLNRVLPSVAAFINWSTEYERTAPMTRVHVQYTEIVADVTGDVRRRACSEEDPSSLRKTVKPVKEMLIETFD